MLIKAVIVILFGIGFVLIPGPVLSLYGVTLDTVGAYMTRLFGASFVLLGLLLWSARRDSGSLALQAIVRAVFIGDVIGFVVSLLGQLASVLNGLGWFVVALYFLLALGFGYFQMAHPAIEPKVSTT